jgi:hypothetical protein
MKQGGVSQEMHVPESRSMARRHALPLSATYSVRWSSEEAMPYGHENLAIWSAPSRNPREPPPATVLTEPAPSPSNPRALLSTGDQSWGSVHGPPQGLRLPVCSAARREKGMVSATATRKAAWRTRVHVYGLDAVLAGLAEVQRVAVVGRG